MSTPAIPPSTPWWHPTWRRLLGLSVGFFLIVLVLLGGRLALGEDPGLKGAGDQAAVRTSGDGGEDLGFAVVDRVLNAVSGDDSDSDDGSSSDNGGSSPLTTQSS
jgi:hypothetical protein